MPTKSWTELLEENEKNKKEWEVIPANNYDMVISKAEAVKSAKGKDGWKIQCKVIDGPNKGRIVFDQHYISQESPIALRIFFQTMKVLGLDDAFWRTNPSPQAIANELVGKVFNGKVGIEKNNKDEDRNVIQNYTTASEAAKQAALSIPTSLNPNPTPSGGSTPSAPQPPAAPAAESAPAPAPEPAPAPAPEPEPQVVSQPDVAAQEAAAPPAPAPGNSGNAPGQQKKAGGALPPPPPPPSF